MAVTPADGSDNACMVTALKRCQGPIQLPLRTLLSQLQLLFQVGGRASE